MTEGNWPTAIERSRMSDHVTALVVSIEPAAGSYYQGYDVSLNGVPLWFRPYDGSSETEAATEVMQALCDVLRAHTGRALPGVGARDA
jgi:hypothetical protein